MGAAYSFVSEWRMPASPERCWAELEQTLRHGGPVPWWPGVSVPVPPPRVAAGERLVLAVRSPLGYRLRVGLEITEVVPGRVLAAAAAGDLAGRGRVLVGERGADASTLVFEWDVTTRRAWMNAAAPLLRPLFARAHGAVMDAGERGLGTHLGS